MHPCLLSPSNIAPIHTLTAKPPEKILPELKDAIAQILKSAQHPHLFLDYTSLCSFPMDRSRYPLQSFFLTKQCNALRHQTRLLPAAPIPALRIHSEAKIFVQAHPI